MSTKEHCLTTVVTEPVPALVGQISTLGVVCSDTRLKVLWGQRRVTLRTQDTERLSDNRRREVARVSVQKDTSCRQSKEW